MKCPECFCYFAPETNLSKREITCNCKCKYIRLHTLQQELPRVNYRFNCRKFPVGIIICIADKSESSRINID